MVNTRVVVRRRCPTNDAHRAGGIGECRGRGLDCVEQRTGHTHLGHPESDRSAMAHQRVPGKPSSIFPIALPNMLVYNLFRQASDGRKRCCRAFANANRALKPHDSPTLSLATIAAERRAG